MFTGARLEEICQLYLQDIIIEDGVLVISVTDADLDGVGKEVKIKKQGSHRQIPMHDKLIGIGFQE